MFIIDWIAKILGYFINWIYLGLDQMGIANLGLTIIIFAFFIRLILFPVTYMTQKNSKIMQVLQPELNKVQKKYRGKKDQDSMMQMQMEQQQIYKKYGTSPTGGCLPVLIQMPILFGVIKIVYNIPNYIPSIGKVYMNIAQPMVDSGAKNVEKLVPLAKELNATRYFKDYTSTTDVISVLARFKDSSWETAKKIFTDFPDVVHNIDQYAGKIKELNDFVFGINIADSPSAHGFSIYLIIPVLAALFQWLQTKTVRQPEMPEGMGGAGNSMKVMMNVMPLMSLVIYYPLSSGIGLYWAAIAFFTMIQQVFLNMYFDHKDIEEIVKKQQEKAKKKNKKTLYEKMMDASMNAADKSGTTPKVPDGAYVNNKKTIGNIAKISTKNIESAETTSTGNIAELNTNLSDKKSGTIKKGSNGSISAIANILKDEK